MKTTAFTRRTLLATALAAGVVVPLVPGRASASASPFGRAGASPVRLTLPGPTGPHPVGTVPLHLIDEARAGREIMTSVWYPAAAGARRHPSSPWMTEAPLRALLADIGLSPDVAAAPLTAGREGAPVAPGRWPVIVYSHGAGGHRSEATVIVQELASHGYVVVTVDHTGDAFTEFPDGRLAVPTTVPFYPWDSAADLRFVLDRVEDLAAGRRLPVGRDLPAGHSRAAGRGRGDAGDGRVPAGLGRSLDLGRVGMFGWSKGATATALVMNTDRRVRAGLGIDGPMQSNPLPAGLDRPFMLMTAEYTLAGSPSVGQFWSRLRGWRLAVQADGALHGSYCDHQSLLPQLAAIIGLSDEELAGWIGTLAPARAVRIQQAYPLAFFDLHLRHRRQRLLEGPSGAFPEVRFSAAG